MGSRSRILEHVISPNKGDLPPDLARFILTLDFPPADHTRYEELTAKAQDGALTAQERDELEGFLDVNDFLAIIQSKARASLAGHSSAA